MIRRHLSVPARPVSGARAKRAATGLAAGAIAAAALAPVASAPATAAAEDCVTAHPTADLVEDQPLTGLTTTRGTTPETFTGTFVDVLDDGIAPGVDMIIARLESPAVEEAGIWQGMSGSPVYTADGELVGAVAYGLSAGPSPIAGITPAEHLLALAAGDPDAVAAESAGADRVALPRATARSVTATGDATSAQASSGLRRLPAPLAVSGLSERRFEQLRPRLDDRGPVTRATGAAGTAAEQLPIVAGGNMAASMSYGTITSAAVGTVTAVCEDRVVGFGHPFGFAGDTTYSLHGAEAVAIQPDVAWPSHKLANIGAPVGTISQDRLAGIAGTLGASPATYPVSATARYDGRTLEGTTLVTEQEMVTDLGVSTALAMADRVLDAYRAGSARATWRIEGLRRDGRPFALEHADIYASGSDIATGPAFDLAGQLYALTGNSTEKVTITSVTTTTEFADEGVTWQLGKVFAFQRGAWRRVDARRPLVLPAGSTKKLKVELYHREHPSRFTYVPVTAPTEAPRRPAALTLRGGSSSQGGDFFYFASDEVFGGGEFFGGGDPQTVPQLLSELRRSMRNDQLAATLSARGAGKLSARRLDLGRVVAGAKRLPVLVVPRG